MISKFKFNYLKRLVADMLSKLKTHEKFDVVIKKRLFTCILVIVEGGYKVVMSTDDELGNIYRFFIEIDFNFCADASEIDYRLLCKLLGLKWSKNHYSTKHFFNELDRQLPEEASEKRLTVSELVEAGVIIPEEAKIFFIGWKHFDPNSNKHPSEKNLAKTLKYFGPEVAELCREYGFSSCWSPNRKREKNLFVPDFENARLNEHK